MMSRVAQRRAGSVARQLQRSSVAGVRSLHALTRAAQARTARAALAIPARSMASVFDAHDTFVDRHLGPSKEADLNAMLKVTGYETMDALIDATVPGSIRATEGLKLGGGGKARGEKELLEEFKAMMSQNKVMRSHIGQGYYDCITPNVILRNILENPAWYTPYTPYQAEIAQGRLEMLLNFQTMVCDMTGLPVANASLLDEATAAAEAMALCFGLAKKGKKQFLVDSNVHVQTIDVMRTRAKGYGIELVVADYKEFDFSNAFGSLVQYPCTEGSVQDFKELTDTAHAAGAKMVVASDLLALSVLTPPGDWGADVVVGSAQRFGVPMGFGGPHAAFFACQDAWKRRMPGRIIGVSRDSRGQPALRMAMQTREQHIRRDKATSNICTAQALLANMSAAYAVYHGPEGIKRIGEKVHAAAKVFAHGVAAAGLTVAHGQYFDTVKVELGGANNAADYLAAAEELGINLRAIGTDALCVSFDETTRAVHVDELVQILASVKGTAAAVASFSAEQVATEIDVSVSPQFARESEYLTHPVFNMYHCETEMLRYLYLLQSRDLSLCTAMMPLGSCTMKLNGTSEMIPVTWNEVANMHPFAPTNQTKGYAAMIDSLEKDLANITGFHAVSMQPNSGAQGEYAGLLAIASYHASRGEGHRNICLIPTSAHGTNPASAVMNGMKVVVVKCDSEGNIDFADLKAKAELHKDNLAALMVTYPSTHGVFEENIKEVIDLIHDNGGQVYMDGANMNAQVGLCSPGEIGADVCHLNLHKTFCIPHGGGGPGMGPIGVAKQLAPFLPGHTVIETGGEQASGAVAGAPFSSASILPITWMYINLMGAEGLTQATKVAILNANYMAKRLEGHYDVLFKGKNGNCAHEFILDLRPFKSSAGIVEEDVAKRLMDYNFHAPTMSWPVVGTLMCEPTESESLYELDRMCDALIKIREEIREIEEGKADKSNNLLKNAPHTADVVNADAWELPYSRERAAYPENYLRTNKFWPFVGRLDNVFGDRNVICTCPPLESYQ